jgi:hypothetical protein
VRKLTSGQKWILLIAGSVTAVLIAAAVLVVLRAILVTRIALV